jgi:FkbM family methyltransferase
MAKSATRSQRINAHHIGGRGGAAWAAFNARFKDDFDFYVYDADPACFDQMEERSDGDETVIAAAVTGGAGLRELNVNYDPYTSSLLKPDPEHETYFYNNGIWDYVFKDVTRVEEVVMLEGNSLTTLAERHGFALDYVSIDTQGSEFEIISGASEELFTDTVAVRTELSFVPLYQGQKLAEEVMALLRGRGFFPASFENFMDWEPNPAGIGWRGTGFSIHGDVLFFRDITHIVQHSSDPFTTLLKQAFIAVNFGKISFALQCLAEAYKNPNPETLAQAENIQYIRFLDEMHGLYQRDAKVMPLRFPHWHTAEQSKGRFRPGNEKAHSIKDPAVQAQAMAAYFAEIDRPAFERAMPGLRAEEPTPFETLLRDNGFTELSDKVAAKRKHLAARVPFRVGRQ